MKDHPQVESLISELDQLYNVIAGFIEMEQEEIESTAKPVFERLTKIYKLAVLSANLSEETKGWIQPSIDFFTESILNPPISKRTPLTKVQVDELIAWEY